VLHRFIRPFAALAFILAAAAAAARGTVDSVAIPVGALDPAVSVYTRVLTFEHIAGGEESGEHYERLYGVFGARVRVARLGLGREAIELRQFLAPQGRAIPADTRSNDRWFQHIAIIVSDMDVAYARLREHGVAHASTAPQTLPDWNPAAGGIAAFYFRDPDGHHLEVLEFPRGKGDARWQARGPLFLGIDHTAIVVASTDDSLAFYRDTLGMRVAGTSENYGAEQERLNNVFGARLRITALRADDGIGIELLDYLTPRTGRQMPVDTLANDLWHWHVTFERDDLPAIDAATKATSGRAAAPAYVSPGIVTVAAGEGAVRALMLRDPDGHATLLREPRGALAVEGGSYGN
jgi:catechol 2,3-dioxygenase-like lactoylglutathione lyase family enzyme